MNVQQSPQAFAFNATPVMKFYLDSIEAWKRSCDSLAAGAKETKMPDVAAEGAKSAAGFTLASWPVSGEVFFKRFVENQVELCRFFAGRWEQYLKLPAQLARCHSPAEIGQVQTAFMSQCANDYMHEAGKLAQPVGELMAHWAPSRPESRAPVPGSSWGAAA